MGKVTKRTSSLSQTLYAEKPWAKLHMSRKEYERQKMWTRMKISRSKFEQFIRSMPDEAIDLLYKEVNYEIKYEDPADKLIKSLFGEASLKD